MFGSNIDKGWHLFDLRGHPIYVNPLFLALIALFSFIGLSADTADLMMVLERVGIWAPTLFFGILFHEIGHAAALKRFGFGTSDIVLHGFGGVTINRRRQSAPAGQSIAISLAGPFASFLLAFVSFGAYYALTGGVSSAGSAGFFHRFLYIMGLINVVWGVFNLLPINPLDGGHVVLHALRGKYNNRRKAMRQTAIVSLVTVGIVVVVSIALGFQPLFFILIAFIFGFQNWQILQSSGRGYR